MDSITLELSLQHDPKSREVSGGVHACDKLPKRRPRNQRLFIANTDDHTKPGTHWVAFYFTPGGRGIYYDSYGLPPFNGDLLRFVDKNASAWTYNKKKLQDDNSKSCGHHCIFFAYHMVRGWSLAKFQSLFHSNNKINDAMVVDFVKRHYKLRDLKTLRSVQRCRFQRDNIK